MSGWTEEELQAIFKDDDLYISIPNEDGTMHKPTWIWIVQAGDDLYSRGYNGVDARWYKSAKREKQGHISVGGVEKDVRFEFPTDEETLDKVDQGYHEKYKDSSYVPPMVSQKAREATVRILPDE